MDSSMSFISKFSIDVQAALPRTRTCAGSIHSTFVPLSLPRHEKSYKMSVSLNSGFVPQPLIQIFFYVA
jgi:hypothetical protein